MRVKSHGTETGGDGGAGEASKLTERCNPKPTERRDNLFSADRRDVERREERRIVLDDADRGATGCSGSGMLRCERAVGEPDPVPISGHSIDLLHDPFDKRALPAVVADGSSHRDEDQSWLDDLDLRNERFDLSNDLFERDHLRRVISLNRRDPRTDPFRLTPSHPAANPGSIRSNVHRLDPSVGTYRLAGFILWRSGSP